MVALLDSAILRNLHLGRTTLYDLCDEDDEALPVIIAELAKHATNNENGVAAREGECELGTLAIGKRCQERIWATGWGVVWNRRASGWSCCVSRCPALLGNLAG
jgi:hypothetical protein